MTIIITYLGAYNPPWVITNTDGDQIKYYP